jgi:hypothetical protein
MNPGRAVVFTAVGVIVLVTAASGTPLWSVPEKGAGQAPLGDGTASVSVVSTPEQATLEPGRQGGDVYYLRVPDTEIEVSQLRGNPLVSYSIDIDELGYSRSSVTSLGTVGEGGARLSLSEDALDGTRLERQEYEGQLRLVLRGNDEEQVLYDQPITIEVQQ